MPRLLLALTVLPALAVAAPVPKALGRVPDAEAIPGVWEVVSADEGGGAGPTPARRGLRYPFRGDGTMTIAAGDRAAELAYAIDPAATPKAIDSRGPSFNPFDLYELHGDAVRTCATWGPNRTRPPAFKAVDKAAVVITFRRLTNPAAGDAGHAGGGRDWESPPAGLGGGPAQYKQDLRPDRRRHRPATETGCLHMADFERDAFSPGFDTSRLDAIGPWEADAGEDCVDIRWERPAALRTGWVEFDLRFYIGSGSATFDPDRRMFGLYELFLARRDEFVAQLRQLTAGYGEVESATVGVYREGDAEVDDDYSLRVSFDFTDDRESSHESLFDEGSQAFTGLCS